MVDVLPNRVAQVTSRRVRSVGPCPWRARDQLRGGPSAPVCHRPAIGTGVPDRCGVCRCAVGGYERVAVSELEAGRPVRHAGDSLAAGRDVLLRRSRAVRTGGRPLARGESLASPGATGPMRISPPPTRGRMESGWFRSVGLADQRRERVVRRRIAEHATGLDMEHPAVEFQPARGECLRDGGVSAHPVQLHENVLLDQC